MGCKMDHAKIRNELTQALLTDEEFALGQSGWDEIDDPLPEWVHAGTWEEGRGIACYECRTVCAHRMNRKAMTITTTRRTRRRKKRNQPSSNTKGLRKRSLKRQLNKNNNNANKVKTRPKRWRAK